VDTLDKSIASALSEDGRASFSDVGAKLGITDPTVRSRLNKLIAAEEVKISCLVDFSQIRGAVVALLGIRLSGYKLEEKMKQIAKFDEVAWCAVVTGSYDMMAEVVFTDGIQGLYEFLALKLTKMGGIRSTETFVVMASQNKWILLPSGVKKQWLNPKSA